MFSKLNLIPINKILVQSSRRHDPETSSKKVASSIRLFDSGSESSATNFQNRSDDTCCNKSDDVLVTVLADKSSVQGKLLCKTFRFYGYIMLKSHRHSYWNDCSFCYIQMPS